jgi:hypothetical protein
MVATARQTLRGAPRTLEASQADAPDARHRREFAAARFPQGAQRNERQCNAYAAR